MSLQPPALAAIQSAGAAIFDADAALKSAVKAYAAQIEDALASNPFDVSNDSLFEEWKNVARLSQAVSRMEQELRQIYDAAASLAGAKQLQAPEMRRISTASSVEMVETVNATDVVVKPSKQPVRNNSDRVLNALKQLLNETEFRKINISAVANTAGVAQGSMAATLKRLVRDGHLLDANGGHFKLTGRAD